MEHAYRSEAIVDEEGSVRVRAVPFVPGEAVEVIVFPRARRPGPGPSDASLRGSVLRYDDPTEPVAAEDWDLAG